MARAPCTAPVSKGKGWGPPETSARAERRGRHEPNRSRREGTGAHLRLQPEPSGWGSTNRTGLEGKGAGAHLRLKPELSGEGATNQTSLKGKGTGAHLWLKPEPSGEGTEPHRSRRGRNWGPLEAQLGPEAITGIALH